MKIFQRFLILKIVINISKFPKNPLVFNKSVCLNSSRDKNKFAMKKISVCFYLMVDKQIVRDIYLIYKTYIFAIIDSY